MNFYNKDEDKKGAPVIPGAASFFKKTSIFGKTPMFSRATGGIIDRLKSLSRKDMAFVGIGLGTLVMAPVAEHMMSQPAQDNLLRETFNPRSGPGSIMDPGINGLSTGSSDGSGEVITPLSARDPMSLILSAQPAAAAMPPPSAPPSSYRDAVKESGRAAFTEASRSAGAPTVIPRMQSALRNISSFGGDSGGSRTSGILGGGKIIGDARSASSKAKSRSMIGPVAMAGYKGVASTPNSSSKGAFEKLRVQADKSAGNFSGGSAMNSLDKAAADAANISGAGGLGAGGDSEKTGKTSGSTTKYDHNRSGETLAEAAAKARQEKALEWEFFKKYEFKKQLLTAVFGAVSTTVGKLVTDQLETGLGMKPGPAPKCWVPVLEDVNVLKELAIKYQYNPPGYAEAVCGYSGTVQLITQVGKESAQSLQSTCICGRDKEPTYPKNKPGGGNTEIKPGDSDTVIADPRNFSEYDRLLKEVVTLTVEAQVDPKKADGNVKNITGNFTGLGNNVKGPVNNVLKNLVSEADKELADYSQKVISAQNTYHALKPKYDKFAKKLKELPVVIEKGAIGNEHIGNVQGISAERIFDKSELDRAEIAKTTTNWNASGVVNYEHAYMSLRLESDWPLAYTRQISVVHNGINRILTKQAEIDSAVSGITEMDPAKKIKLLTGQDIPAGAAAASEAAPESVPLVLAADLRGVALVWKSPYDLDGKEIVSREGSNWKDWKKENNDAKLGAADSLIVNQMRSNEIKADIALRRLNPPSIEKAFTAVNELISITKNKLILLGIPKSYFDGGLPPNPGTNPGNTPAANDPLVGRQTALLANSGNIGSDYQAAAAVHAKLGPGTNAEYAKSDYRKMTDNRAGIVRLTNELSAPGAKPTKEKLDELEMYQTNFNKSYGDFQTHAKAAGATVPQPPVTPVPPPQSKPAPAPLEIHKVQLVKGKTTIPAVNHQGAPVYAERCIKWGVGFMSAFTGGPVCKEYEKLQVQVEINDYYLGYGTANGQDLPLGSTYAWGPTGTTSMTTTDGTVHFKDASIKRNEYDMEVQVACHLSGGNWVIKSAMLRKGTASSANNLGGKVSGGWDLGPKLTAEISYSHTWNNYNHGEMLPFDGLVGKPCK